MVSTSPFMGLTKTLLNLLQNVDATDEGGVCFGDSGGPHFIGETDIVAAISSLSDINCRALGQHYRMDIESARDFLEQFVDLP